MAVITAESSSNYIRSAPLPLRAARGFRDDSHPAAPVELKNTEAQALVVGSSLVAAAEGVPAQTRADIVNSTLFAQLAASGRVTDPGKVNEWYQEYFRALTALGWAQSDSRFEEFETRGSGLETHKSIIKVLATLLGPGAAALAVVTETLTALQELDQNSPWITLFNTQSTAVHSARFQVATAQLGSSGPVEIALVAFDLRARVSITQVLFFKFKSNSTRLRYSSGHATIYEAVLAQHRELVARRLADYQSAYIGEVAFPPPPPRRQGMRARRRVRRMALA